MTKVNREKIIPVPENYDFPEPIFDDEIDVGWDILTYLHKAAEYEKWAERVRNCGQDDLEHISVILQTACITEYALVNEVIRLTTIMK